MIIGTKEPDIVEGMVHICYDGQWGMAIGPSWTLREASVVCRQLHYAPVALKHLPIPPTVQLYYNSIALVMRKKSLTVTIHLSNTTRIPILMLQLQVV